MNRARRLAPYLCRLAAARVAGHHDHLVLSDRVHDGLLILEDGQVLLVGSDLHQLVKLVHNERSTCKEVCSVTKRQN